MKKQIKAIPKFESEADEIAFWDKHDFTDYFDLSKAKRMVFPNLKPTSKSISIRLPAYMISRLKEKANLIDVPYQALIKQSIAKDLAK